MKNLILIVICMLCSFSLLCGCIGEEKKQNALSHAMLTNRLVVGVKCDSKPFGYVDKDGNIQGFDVDIASSIAQQILGNEKALELVCVTAQSRISDLNSKSVDILVAAMSITELTL